MRYSIYSDNRNKTFTPLTEVWVVTAGDVRSEGERPFFLILFGMITRLVYEEHNYYIC